MTDVISDGMTRVTIAPAIANIAQPTVAELDAGLNVTDQMTSDGLIAWEAATAGVPNTSLASKVDTSRAGRDSFSGPKLRLKEQSPTDTVKSTVVKGYQCYVVIRRAVATETANAALQKCAVFPVEAGRRIDMPHEDNTMARYEIPFFVHTPPNHDAVVA